MRINPVIRKIPLAKSRIHKTKRNIKSPADSLSQRMLRFVKDWGGVATVVIAILYTFPFQVFDRVVNKRQHDVQTARDALSQFASLQVDRLVNISRISDPQSKELMNNMYQIRTYNIINQNKDLFLRVAGEMIFSELYSIGGSFSLNGQVSDSLPFYELSLSKTRNSSGVLIEETPAVLREMGSALFSQSSSQDIRRARALYLEALKILDDRNNPPSSLIYARYLSELGYWEMEFGDWKCGKDAMTKALSLLGLIANVEQNEQFLNIYKLAYESNSRARQRPNQPEEGCSYPGQYTEASIKATVGRFGFTAPAPPPTPPLPAMTGP